MKSFPITARPGNARGSVRRLACTVFAILASAASTVLSAASYSISYTGTISDNTFAEINNGEPYTVTLVFDNGNASTVNQTWVQANLQCVIFTMNTANNVSFAQNLTATNSRLQVTGSLTTDGAGALSSIFSEVNENSGISSSYSVTGFAPATPIQWYLDSLNDIFYENGSGVFGDGAGGVQMNTADWSNPVAFAGACPAAAAVPPVALPAPAMSDWAKLLIATLMLGIGVSAITLRRRLFSASR